MSSYQNVVVGKLKLKGKALDVKSGGVKKKKKQKHHSRIEEDVPTGKNDLVEGGSSDLATELEKQEEGDLTELEKQGDLTELEKQEREGEEGDQRPIDDFLTPAERRYLEQKERIESHRSAKTADKSHRDRISKFNQYLANLSEHYDIPKVGPG
ncbi:Protein FAM32A-like protein [Carex littledalei]|uniref:Protein FAM32A-like protein n=1 Tax=Carex littledalei TaxID=544730 RepID=A0A833R222_9POAL|nr:Protein FAM32A-like protein [Carex littledalei]